MGYTPEEVENIPIATILNDLAMWDIESDNQKPPK